MLNLTLYTYWRSSSAYRVRIALALKNLPHTSIPVNLLAAEQMDPAYRAKNPMGFVPTLLVGEKLFVESVAIIELLEELSPLPALYPLDPFAKAKVRALVETVNAGTQPLQNLSVLKHLTDDKETRNAWARHFIARGLAAFEALMDRHHAEGVSGPYAYGKTLTAADCFLVPQMYNALRYDMDLGAMPRVVAANEAALAHAAVKQAHPENQPDAQK